MNEEAVDSSYVCVYDLETQSTIASVPGRRREDQIGNLQISVLCAVTIPTRLAMDPLRSEEAMANAARHTFWRDDNSNPLGPFEKLLQLFDNADLICGYNISGFDNIVMKKHYAGRRDRYYSHALKMHDCFCRIKDATGVWFKLDALLKANGLETKTADGLEAIKMWQRGERDRLADYCLTDTLQCARLMLRKEIDLLGLGLRAKNHVFGIAAALASVQRSDQIAQAKEPSPFLLDDDSDTCPPPFKKAHVACQEEEGKSSPML